MTSHSAELPRRFCEMMKFEVERAREWFAQGLPLVQMVDRKLALDIELFSRGGQEILNAIERQGYEVLGRRPSISKRASWRWWRARLHPAAKRCAEWERDYSAVGMRPYNLRRALAAGMAYSVCRGITRAAAKNFYYGFLVFRRPSAMLCLPCTLSCGTATTLPTIPA